MLSRHAGGNESMATVMPSHRYQDFAYSLSKQPIWQLNDGQSGSVTLRDIIFMTGQSD